LLYEGTGGESIDDSVGHWRSDASILWVNREAWLNRHECEKQAESADFWILSDCNDFNGKALGECADLPNHTNVLRRALMLYRCPPQIGMLLGIALLLAAGCNLVGPNRRFDAELEHYKEVARTVESADAITPPSAQDFTTAPHTIRQNAIPTGWQDLTVEEAIHLALANSSVLRDLGGTVLRYPETTRTILGPAVAASDPRFGMEAALSEFDAQLATSVVAEKNDRQVNNFIASGGTRFFQQDLVNFQSEISKLTASGTQFSLRGLSTYDLNNASFNKFPSVWDSQIEAEFRQPMLQGAGTRFNRLAGPRAVPGFYNGVLIARVNTDISAAEFEVAIRDLVSNVENAYWDLYFAFRDLDAKIQARNTSLEVWKSIAVLRLAEQAGGKPEREAQAREQYFRYEEEVQNALAGKLQDATTNNNGSSGGSFRGTGGVLVCERRLRLAMGLPINEDRMLRPIDDPTMANISFEWLGASGDAVVRRPELARQRLIVKRREMEYVASRNFLLPRLDVVGRYRWRGLGKGLFGDVDLPPADPDQSFENSSMANLFGGDFQEWQLGGEVSLPIGHRRAYAGVRNAQLNLARDKAILEEQERQIIHDLSNALADLDRAYAVMQSSYNRRVAAQQNVELIRAAMAERPDVNPEQLLEAARRLSEADVQYQKALVEHMLAIKNVHFEKGTLLDYGKVQLAEQLGSAPAPPPAPVPVPLPADPLPQPVIPQPSAASEPTPAAPPAGIPPAVAPPAAPPGAPPVESTLPPPTLPPAGVQTLPNVPTPAAPPTTLPAPREPAPQTAEPRLAPPVSPPAAPPPPAPQPELFPQAAAWPPADVRQQVVPVAPPVVAPPPAAVAPAPQVVATPQMAPAPQVAAAPQIAPAPQVVAAPQAAAPPVQAAAPAAVNRPEFAPPPLPLEWSANAASAPPEGSSRRAVVPAMVESPAANTYALPSATPHPSAAPSPPAGNFANPAVSAAVSQTPQFDNRPEFASPPLPAELFLPPPLPAELFAPSATNAAPPATRYVREPRSGANQPATPAAAADFRAGQFTTVVPSNPQPAGPAAGTAWPTDVRTANPRLESSATELIERSMFYRDPLPNSEHPTIAPATLVVPSAWQNQTSLPAPTAAQIQRLPPIDDQAVHATR
jgi:outer membrane protein TolC